MNKLLLTGFLTAGAAIHNLSAQTTAGQGNQQKDEQRPNILFILSDDHTSQAWGIYGGVLADYAYNNNIRRLANEGVVLDNCFCTNSISAPSRASILTGLYSHRNGLYTLADSLNTSIPTFYNHMDITQGLSGNGISSHSHRASIITLSSTTRENIVIPLLSKVVIPGRVTDDLENAYLAFLPISSQKKQSTGSSNRTASNLS